jgi:hypothetical protein
MALGVLLSAREGSAQWNLAQAGEGKARMYTTFGLDPAMVATVGLSQGTPVVGQPVTTHVELGVAAARLDLKDFRGALGAQASFYQWKSVHLTGSFSLIARGTTNSVYEGFDFGAEAAMGVGVYRPRWFVAGEFGKDKAVMTHVRHTQWYRKNVYPDARDGWYLPSGGRLRYGVSGARSFGRFEAMLRMGVQRTEGWKSLQPPAYALLGLGVRL